MFTRACVCMALCVVLFLLVYVSLLVCVLCLGAREGGAHVWCVCVCVRERQL